MTIPVADPTPASGKVLGMPEGHTLHRLARQLQRLYGGQVLRASSLQERFVDGAAVLDGRRLVRAEAYGKHLLQHYEGVPSLHVHLGLYGKVTSGAGPPPPPSGALRLRLVGNGHWSDLRGPTACELIEPDGIVALLARLGPDPLRRDADPERAFGRIARSRVSIAALLMDQKVLAGVGNVYRAEILFRHRLDPYRAGQSLTPTQWSALWLDLVGLMKSGVRSGRIVTTEPADRDRRSGPARRLDAHYVYRRAGLGCRVCGTPIATTVLVGRNLFWCPYCQGV